jgi:hypothetical protein
MYLYVYDMASFSLDVLSLVFKESCSLGHTARQLSI